MINIEEMKEELQEIENNIAIYKHDVKRLLAKLKNEFNISEFKINGRLEKIDEKLEELKEKRKRTERKIEIELDKVKDE